VSSSHDVEFLASCWTHSDAVPIAGANLSRYDLRTRAEAVARAGFTGIGFTIDDLAASTIELGTLATLLDDLGLQHREVELLENWWATDARRQHSDVVRTQLLRAAETLGARSIKIAPDADTEATEFPPLVDVSHWAAELNVLAGQAESVGSRVAIEPLPFSNIADFRLAGELIEAADHPAAGLTVDIWHVERGPSTLSDLAALPAGSVFIVELNDAAAEPKGHPFQDTIRRRVLPGSGAFDLSGFIGVLRDGGFSGPWGVEMLSDDHRSKPLDEALHDAITRTRELFDSLDLTTTAH
jgi:sugar phosphate isomerase/epimerase